MELVLVKVLVVFSSSSSSEEGSPCFDLDDFVGVWSGSACRTDNRLEGNFLGVEVGGWLIIDAVDTS